MLELQYAPSAQLLLVNHGWKVAKQKMGFLIHLSSGEFVENEKKSLSSKGTESAEWLKLCVTDVQNLLRIRVLPKELREDMEFMMSLMYALERGIEQTFQIEDLELEAELLGQGEHLAMVFYENAEGGVGVLRELVRRSEVLSEVAHTALELLHFDPETGRDLAADGHTACYECLLSYYNQLRAHQLNRYRVKSFLEKLKEREVSRRYGERSAKEHYHWLCQQIDPRSPLERQLLDLLYRLSGRLPDAAQKGIETPRCVVDFFYEPNVCVFCDGPPHDHPKVQDQDQKIRRQLLALGYRVIVIRHDQDLLSQVKKYPEVFGVKKT